MASAKSLLVLLGLSGIVVFCGCQNKTTTEDPKNAIAFYSYSAGPYSETVTLWLSGKYLQTLTQKAYKPYTTTGGGEAHVPAATGKQTGVWGLLDKPGGMPLPLPITAITLPPNAVVEIKHAMPFGLVFENQPAYAIDRTIMVSEFRIKKPGQPLQVQ